jgi:hypothetical protein
MLSTPRPHQSAFLLCSDVFYTKTIFLTYYLLEKVMSGIYIIKLSLFYMVVRSDLDEEGVQIKN